MIGNINMLHLSTSMIGDINISSVAQLHFFLPEVFLELSYWYFPMFPKH